MADVFRSILLTTVCGAEKGPGRKLVELSTGCLSHHRLISDDSVAIEVRINCMSKIA